MYTVAGVAEALATELGENYADPTIQEQFHAWVNDAAEEVWFRYPWGFRKGTTVLTTAIGASSYPLEGGLERIDLIRLGDTGRTLSFREEADLRVLGISPDTDGEPWAWSYEGIDTTDPADPKLIIRLSPTPSLSETFTVVGLKGFPTPAVTAAVPMPYVSVFAVKAKARERAHENAGELPLAQKYEQRFEGYLQEMRKEYIGHPGAHLRIEQVDVRYTGGNFPRPDIVTPVVP